ncbi:hypothetical protein VPH35_064552 [Triticum aestivum]
MCSASPPTTMVGNQAFAAGALQYRPLYINLQEAMKFTGTTPSRVKKIHFQWSQYSLEFHFDDCQGQAHQRMDCGSMSKGTILDRQMSGLLLMQLLLLLINLSFHSLLLG